jgi:ribosome-binding protein aMBF1 (putative translation factor)
MDVQIIEKNGHSWAMIPYEEYRSLVELAELAEDMPAYKQASMPAHRAGEKALPEDMTGRLWSGESPVKVWREFRGLSPERLAELAGVSPSYLAQIEAGRPTVRIDKLKRIALALDVHLENVIKDG